VLHCVDILKRNTDPVLSMFLRSSINSRNKDVSAENVLLLGTIWFKRRTSVNVTTVQLVANQCIAAINSIMAGHFDYQSVSVIMVVM